MSTALLPRRGAVIAQVARVVSWPLTALAVLAGLAGRVAAALGWVLLVPGLAAIVGGAAVLALLCLGLDTSTLGRLVWALVALGACVALAAFAVGGLRRIARGDVHPLAAARAVWGSIPGYAFQGGCYLTWESDELPRFLGAQRAPGESLGPWHETRRRLTRSRTAMVCWIGLAAYLMVGIAAQAGWIAGDYAETQRDRTYERPAGLGDTPALGRDLFGRDVASMGLRGTATALWIGTFAAVLACVVGSVLGALAGFYGGWIDAVVVWLYTTLESIPELLLVLAFSFVFKVNEGLRDAYNGSFMAETLGIPIGLLSLVIVMGLTFWTGVCRQVRGEFLRQRERDYVLAGRALGLSSRRIAFRHVFPNVFHLVLVSFSLLFIGAIKYEVVLTFLGVGMDAGEASWGRMIEQAKLELLREPSVWWQLGTATALLFGLVLCVNLFADALRDALDPRLRT